VMLIEDCPVTAILVERVILHEIPECRILWARGVKEACQRAEGLPVDVFVTDVGLPDGNGFDLLWRVSGTHPNSRAIVITATPLPEHEAHSAALGVVDFLEKPLNIPGFISRLRQALNMITKIDEGRDFRATLEHVNAGDIVQLKCLCRATTIVDFQSEGRVGSIRFEDGEITHAETGGRKGIDALSEILAWKRGHVNERPYTGMLPRTIEGSWQGLLMEAAQRSDERQMVAA
jgi:CheY-like chemotaxis protein